MRTLIRESHDGNCKSGSQDGNSGGGGGGGGVRTVSRGSEDGESVELGR